MTHWTNAPQDISSYFGFIYRITNLLTGRQYIGKKQFHSYRKHLPKGKKRKVTIQSESDWQTYTGSCTSLNADIEKYGMDNFRFEIEELHLTKGQLHYAEVERQVIEDVLRSKFADGSRKFYNGMINAVKFIPAEIKNGAEAPFI